MISYAVPDGSYDLVLRQQEAIAVWWVVGLGAALGLLPRAKVRSETLWTVAPLAILVGWTALGLLWTTSEERTLEEVVRTTHYAGVVVLALCLASPATWRSAAAGLVAGAVAVCGLAIASRVAPDLFSDTVAAAYGLNRLSYPLGYWNAVAAWGAMTAAMALLWSAHARTAGVRAASLAAVPIASLTTYLTYSRAGIAAMAVALLAAVALPVNRITVLVHAVVAASATGIVIVIVRERPDIANGTGTAGAGALLLALLCAAIACALAAIVTRRGGLDRWRLDARIARPAIVIATAVLLVGVAAIGRPAISDAWDEFRTTGVAAAPSSQAGDPAGRLNSLRGTRYEVYSSALRAVRDDPLLGIGPGTFEFHWNREGGKEFLRDSHSLYLEQAAELGVPGAALTLAALGALAALGIAACLRLRRRDPSHAGAAAALCAAYLVFLFYAGVDWMWESTAVTVLAMASVSLACASGRRPRAHPRWPLRAGLLAVAVVACAAALPGLLSTVHVRASQAAFNRGERARALSEAEEAVSRQPAAAGPYAQRALVRWSEREFDLAADDLERARDREASNWRYSFLLARLEAERGRRDRALRAFRQARVLRPSSAIFVRGLPPGAPAPPPTEGANPSP